MGRAPAHGPARPAAAGGRKRARLPHHRADACHCHGRLVTIGGRYWKWRHAI